MEDLWLAFRLLCLLGVANGAPIVAARLLGERWSTPLDSGARFLDGAPVLGPRKTVRGVIAAMLASALVAPVLGLPMIVGVQIGAAAMAGDALSSFVKRRLAIPPSGRATGLDQIPEALLPLLAVRGVLDLSVLQILGVVAAFFALERPVARLFYRLGIRNRPY
jgi:CDP-2,3-bis-(O-geranylgeranyl)-sn-glycerol synthase